MSQEVVWCQVVCVSKLCVCEEVVWCHVVCEQVVSQEVVWCQVVREQVVCVCVRKLYGDKFCVCE